MSTQEEMRKEFNALYNIMASSNEVAFMHAFGQVHKEMMEWMIQNKPDMAQEWIEKLESIRWKNYLTTKEADTIVNNMVPRPLYNREQWRQNMEQHGLELEREPYYNRCALFATMSMIMSDSGETLKRYVESDKLFKAVYDLAVDKLTDKDGVFNIREYFGL